MRGLQPTRDDAMTSAELSVSGMALFFLLGLRHGIEPDHIAAIDGLTLRAHDQHERHAPWTGSLFAVGHGLAIGVIAVGVSFLAASFRLPAALVEAIDWVPIVLLSLLGLWNLRALLAPGTYRPNSVRMKLVPAALRERTDLWSTVAIGVFFALVVDTVAHISAWSVFATHRGGWWAGAVAGLLFSLGMLIASTADSQLISRVLRGARSEAAASRLRRGIGWVVVLLSFAVVIQSLFSKLASG